MKTDIYYDDDEFISDILDDFDEINDIEEDED